jgi:pimeloyl-ACP methyl ester carboxylesterase
MQTVRVPVTDGIALACDRFDPPPGSPAGAAFVLVHGLASNARLWDGVARRLVALGHPVVTVDLRGHGRSSRPDGPYDVPAVADDVAAVIGALGLERPVVAGQSWGGNVVLELGARHPALVRGIACIDGGWLEPSREFDTWDACLAALAPPRLAGRPLVDVETYLRTSHAGWPEAGIRGFLGNFEVRPDGTIAPWLTYERHVEVLRGMWQHRPSERYAVMEVPVLLLPVDTGQVAWTERKRIAVAAAEAAIPRCRVRWFSGDHDIHAQHPDEVADVLHEMTTDGFTS